MFDLIYYSNSYHFTREINFEERLKEANRVLKSNGIIFITEPLPKPQNWGVPEFNENNELFDEKKWQKRKKLLKLAEASIYNQQLFTRLCHDKTEEYNFFILKKI